MSICTFYFAFPRPANLEVFLTGNIYVRLDSAEADLVTPIFLHNPGSAGTVLIVQDAIATLRVTCADKSTQEFQLPWTEIRRLVRREEYKAADSVAGVDDFLITESRRVPMAIEGKKTELRYLRFQGALNKSLPPGPLDLNLSVRVIGVRRQEYPSDIFAYQISKEQREDPLASKIYLWPTPR
ncbi:MAG: hypothetical protein ACXV97_00315 [Chthoniobacterales bacterium]